MWYRCTKCGLHFFVPCQDGADACEGICGNCIVQIELSNKERCKRCNEGVSDQLLFYLDSYQKYLMREFRSRIPIRRPVFTNVFSNMQQSSKMPSLYQPNPYQQAYQQNLQQHLYQNHQTSQGYVNRQNQESQYTQQTQQSEHNHWWSQSQQSQDFQSRCSFGRNA